MLPAKLYASYLVGGAMHGARALTSLLILVG
jgi:hypothetical protein